MRGRQVEAAGINDDAQIADRLCVSGAPAKFVNGKFVANPTTEWADVGLPQDEVRETEFAKSELKAMIERKRRNDFVRKREFDMLRKVRREGLSPEQLAALGGSSKVDDSEARELFLVPTGGAVIDTPVTEPMVPAIMSGQNSIVPRATALVGATPDGELPMIPTSSASVIQAAAWASAANSASGQRAMSPAAKIPDTLVVVPLWVRIYPFPSMSS